MLVQWCELNGMILNAWKCARIVFSRRRIDEFDLLFIKLGTKNESTGFTRTD